MRATSPIVINQLAHQTPQGIESDSFMTLLVIDLRMMGKGDLFICSLCCPQRAGVVDLRINVASTSEYSHFEESLTERYAFAELLSKSTYIYPSGEELKVKHSKTSSRERHDNSVRCGNLQALHQLRIQLKGCHLRFIFRYAFFTEWREISN